MTIKCSTPHGDVEVSECALRACAEFADRSAALFVEVRRQLGFPGSPDTPHPIPAWYALEFAALLQIARWRQAGLPIEEWDLPSVPEAAQQIVSRLSLPRDQVPSDAPLSGMVLRTFMTKLAWSAPDILDAETEVSSGEDEAEFVDRMARFLLDQVRGTSQQTMTRTSQDEILPKESRQTTSKKHAKSCHY